MMATEKKQEIYMVWAKTEKAGQIVKPDDSKKDSKWLYFTDGTRINKSLVNELMMQAQTQEEAQSISKTLTGVGVVNTPTPDAGPTKSVKTQPESDPANVMVEMLKKMSVKNQAEVGVKVNLPSPEVYDMLIDQMDVTKQDLNEHISLLMEDQIDSMRDQIKTQIKEFIIKYYTT